LYQHLLLTAERKFWRCVQSGEEPRLFGVEPPRPRFRQTRQAHFEHESAKAELKKLVPEDAKEAFGHGVKAKRSKSGAISFELLVEEGGDAQLQRQGWALAAALAKAQSEIANPDGRRKLGSF
jgi:hypothetical protein